MTARRPPTALAAIATLALGCAAVEPGDVSEAGAGDGAAADEALIGRAGDAGPLDAPALPPPPDDGGKVADDRGAPRGDAGRAAEAGVVLLDGGGPVPDGGAPPPPPPPPPPPADAGPACGAEVCNGLDDDCNGTIDDHGACGAYVQSTCRLFAAWADERRGPGEASPTWGGCPGSERAYDGDVRCTATRRDGRFAQLDLGGDVNGDDQLAFALLCDDPAQPALAGWIERHCAFFLGHADDNDGLPDGSLSWGGCPNVERSNEGDLRCTSTGFDRQFRALRLQGDVDDNDDLGVAWICRDDADPGRAAAVAASVEVFLGHADDDRGPGDGAESFGPCPAAGGGEQGGRRCVGTRGDQRFHRLDLTGDVDDNDDLGLALRARPAP